MVTVFSANNRNNIPSEFFTPLFWHCFHSYHPCLQLFPFLHSYLRFVSIEKWGSDHGCRAEKFGKKWNAEVDAWFSAPHWQPHKEPRTHAQHVSISDVSVSDVWGTGQSEVHSLPTPPRPLPWKKFRLAIAVFPVPRPATRNIPILQTRPLLLSTEGVSGTLPAFPILQ